MKSYAQANRKISGTVTDTSKVAVPNIKVIIIAGKDTLTTSTDEDGEFKFSKINADEFSLKVVAIGYQDFKDTYNFTEKEKHKKLDVIRLKTSSDMLKEVVIKGKPNPVRFMQDTVEYNAAAFRVEEGDNLADLVKQLPGLEVDDDYNVKTQDKPVLKLRINGKDFFTSNLKDFIAKLPAGMVSKIQIIDDFGDFANFTGVKTGDPQKMLNIVTKPGMNKGTFGDANADAGTNNLIGGRANMNLWNDDKQSSASVNASTSNNGAGHSQQLGIGLTHNDKLGKIGTGGFNYNFSDNSAAFNSEQQTESLTPDGNFLNHTQSNGDNQSGNHSLRWNMNLNSKQIFMQMNIGGTYNYSNNESMSFSQQSGLIHQDLKNGNSSNSKSPNLNGNIVFSKKLKKDIFSTTISFSLNGHTSDQHISTNTLYYDKNTGALAKDSLLNRDVDSRTGNQRFSFGVNYSVGLKKPKDSLARRSLNFNYDGSASWSDNNVNTFVFDNLTNKVSLVDSLSTSFNSVTYNQLFGGSYNYNGRKMRYNLGFNATGTLLTNHDLKLSQTTVNNTFNYSPNISFSRTLSEGKVLSFNYSGSSRSPTLDQLQPIKNAQSLQNILVGNPDLKTSFSHSIATNFNYVQKSGRSLQVGLNASLTENEIVSDVTLIPDTLNSLKQVTRYENINGNYQFGSNYSVNIPISQNKFSFSYSGHAGFSNRVILFNHQTNSAKGFNFSQSLSGRMSFKKFAMNGQVSYTVANNNNVGPQYSSFGYQSVGIGQISAPAFFKNTTISASLYANLRLEKLKLTSSVSYNNSHNDGDANQVIKNNTNINMNLNGQITIHKTYFTDFGINKRLNYGYAIANPSPLIINVGLGKRFLKDKSLNMSLRGSDLLGQGNNISRTISGNTVIDSRNLQNTRVFSLNLNYNLSYFGGKHMRVDPD